MSLLIKALQKAEQSKGAAVDLSASSLDELELVPHHAALADEAGFGAASGTAVRGETGRNAQQAAASTVFRAKLDAASGDGSRALWIGGGGLIFLLLVGGGFYYYLNSLGQPDLVAARPISIAPPPTPAEVPTPPAEGAVVAESPVNAAPVETAPVEPGPEVAVKPAETTAPVSPAEKPAAAAVPAPAAKPQAQVAEESPVKVTRSRTPAATVNSSVMAAYQAFMAGDDTAAGRLYRQALQSEPRNIDALLGLAAVAARQDNADQAGAYYVRVLELEPKNPVAQAGLIGLMGQADPVASESRLKSMLAQQPEAAFLHAALGNLYADQGQWPSAQQSYFQAYRYDPDNAEYAFNLAVSLDQMGKGSLAAEHYQRALDLLPKQGASVLDRAQIEARIAQLRK